MKKCKACEEYWACQFLSGDLCVKCKEKSLLKEKVTEDQTQQQDPKND
jgi:hypothetical protein